MGFSRNYDGNAAKIREKLQPALEELEQIGFLEPMTKEERYEKQGRDWTIRLVKKGSLASRPAPSQAPGPGGRKPTRPSRRASSRS